MPDRTSIRAQLLLLVLAVVLPAAGLVAYVLHERLNEARRVAQQQLQTLAQDTAGRFEIVLQRRADFMANLVKRPQMRTLDAQQCDVIFGEIRSLQPDFLTLELRKPDGELLCAAQPTELAADVVRALPWFSAGLANGHFAVGGPYALPPSGTWGAMLTQPVRNAAGEVGGLLILAIDLPKQQQALPVLPDDMLVVVFDRELRYLMRSLDAARWIGQPLPAPQRAQIPARIGELFELTGVDGVTRLNVGASVPSSGWQVYAAMPVDRVYAGYRALLLRSLGLGAAALALAGLLGWRLGRHIARPIDALAASAAAVAGGHAAPPPGGGSREVAAAAADLHRVADEREQMRDRHARLSASYEQLADAARDIVLVVDLQDDRIVQANHAALAAYGYSRDELLAMNITDLRAPAARAEVARDRTAALRPQGALYETLHQRKDGSILPVEVSGRPFDIGGRLHFQSFIRDVTERKRSETLLEGQRSVLAQIAQGAPLAESLDALARLVEAQAPGLVATILLLDDDGLHVRHGAAPSLPPAFVEAIDGAAIGPRAGSCGTAACRRAPVLSEDIATDGLWDDWRALALAHGLRACWSTPIVDAAGQVLGTFAMYFRQPGRPDAAHQRLVDLVTHTAAIAIIGARSARAQRAQLDELLRWQALMIDREERMGALKDEADALRARLGEAPRYADAGRP